MDCERDGWNLGAVAVSDEAGGRTRSGADIDVRFVRRQRDQWLIEVMAILANRGFVRHCYRSFTLTLRYILPRTEIRDGDAAIHHQLHCCRTLDERIGGKRRGFANTSYIDPRLTFRNSYVTFIPSDATFVWLQCKLEFSRQVDGQMAFEKRAAPSACSVC